MRFYELRQKEVIDIKEGVRLGYVSDIELDHKKGEITKLIIPGPAKVFGMFGREQEYRVEWEKVTRIGDDFILLECDIDKALVDCDSE